MEDDPAPGGRADPAGEPGRYRSRRLRGDDGAALVEFAILAPLIFALLLGMFTGGMALSQKNSMTNAVREGARLGATVPEDAAWAASVRARVVSLAAGDLDEDQICVKLIRKPTADTETLRRAIPPVCPFGGEPSSVGVPVGECAVKVWARRPSRIDAVIYSQSLTLEARSINRYERAGDPETCAL